MRQKEKDRNPNSRFDQDSQTYQCASCSNLERLWGHRKDQMVEFLAKKYPADNPPRIRNLEQLKELMSLHTREMNPNLIEAGRTALKSKRRDKGYSASGVTRRHMIRAWSQKDLPKNVRLGLCIVCDKIAMTTKKPPNFHKHCYDQWQREDGVQSWSLRQQGQSVLRSRGAGHPTTEEDLKRSYSWAIQYCFKEDKSYRAIAREYGMHFTSVKYRIKSFIENLPEPHLLGSRFRRSIEELLAAAHKKVPSLRLPAQTSDFALL